VLTLVANDHACTVIGSMTQSRVIIVKLFLNMFSPFEALLIG